MNATLVNLVDPENPESLKPLIDGGTEGLYLPNTYYCTVLKSNARIQRPSARYSPHPHFML
jgi:hypothetical protein